MIVLESRLIARARLRFWFSLALWAIVLGTANGWAMPAFASAQPDPIRPPIALIESWSASPNPTGLELRWRTAGEHGAMMFRVFRQKGGVWSAIGSDPVPADNAAAGAEYAAADAGSRFPSETAYRLLVTSDDNRSQWIDLRPDLFQAEWPRVRSSAGTAAAASGPPLKIAAAWTGDPTPLESLGLGHRVKIWTGQGGVHAVRASALAQVLGQSESEVRSWIQQRRFALANRGQPVGWLAGSDGDELYFYAEPRHDLYTDRNVYWLTAGSPPLAGRLDGRKPGVVVEGVYRDRADYEQDLLSVLSLATSPQDDHWIWKRLFAGVPLFDSARIPCVLSAVQTNSIRPAVLKLRVWGGSVAPHAAQIQWNAQTIGQWTWNDKTQITITAELPASILRSGTNELALKAIRLPGASNSQWYLDGFSLEYDRRFVANSSAIEFDVEGDSAITISGFRTPDLQLWDISNPRLPLRVDNLAMGTNQGSVQIGFEPARPGARYVAWEEAAAATPISIGLSANLELAHRTNRAELVILAPASLIDAAEHLADYRGAAWIVRLIPWESVVDEFGDGIAGPDALAAFLKTAVLEWAMPPRLLTLVGNGTHDYRNIKGAGDNLLPTALIATPFGLAHSDLVLGDLDRDGIPEITIGRLPARQPAEVEAILAKIRSVETNAAPVPPEALVVADLSDSAGDFTADALEIESILEDSFAVDRLLRGDGLDAAALRSRLLERIGRGMDLMDYSGHGAIDRLGLDGYLMSSDVPGLRLGHRPPFLVTATCVAGLYGEPGFDCLAETLLLAGQRGIVGAIAPSGLSWNTDAARLNGRLMTQLEAGGGRAIGDLLRHSLAGYVANDQVVTLGLAYNLLGDPATRLRLPPPAPGVHLPPAVALMPPSSSKLSAPARLELAAAALGSGSPIQQVELYRGPALLGTLDQPPYVWTVTDMAPGVHEFRAVAIDAQGAQASSSPCQVQVVAGNQPPQVRFSAPADGAAFLVPAGLCLSVQASDPDGQIQRIDLFQDGRPIGAISAESGSLALTNLGTGQYAFSAIARDNQDTPSGPALIHVAVPPLRIDRAEMNSGTRSITWTGGHPPFQVEGRRGLEPGLSWETIGSPVTTREAMLPASIKTGFLRVLGSQGD